MWLKISSGLDRLERVESVSSGRAMSYMLTVLEGWDICIVLAWQKKCVIW